VPGQKQKKEEMLADLGGATPSPKYVRHHNGEEPSRLYARQRSLDFSPRAHTRSPSFQVLLEASVNFSKQKACSLANSPHPPFQGILGVKQPPKHSRAHFSTGSLVSPLRNLQANGTFFPDGQVRMLSASLAEDPVQEESGTETASDEATQGSRDESFDDDELPESEENGSEYGNLSMEELRAKVEDLSDKLLHAAELGQHLLNEKDQLEAEIASKSDEAMSCKAENIQLWQKIEEVSKDNTQLRILNLKINTKNRLLTDPEDDVTPKDLAELSVPHSPLRPTTPKTERMKRQIDESQGQLNAAQCQILELKDVISDLEDKLDEAEIEKSALRRKIKDLECIHSPELKRKRIVTPLAFTFSPLLSPTAQPFAKVEVPLVTPEVVRKPPNEEKRSQKAHNGTDLMQKGTDSTPTPKKMFTPRPRGASQSLLNSSVALNASTGGSENSLDDNSAVPNSSNALTRDTEISLNDNSQVPTPKRKGPHKPRGHRRGGGLGKRARESHELSMSRQEFHEVMEQARNLDERLSQVQQQLCDGSKGTTATLQSATESEIFEPEQEIMDDELLERIKATIGLLQSDNEQMQAVINAQRAQIRSYREKEKGYYISSSMNSGDYTNLAKELATEEGKINMGIQIHFQTDTDPTMETEGLHSQGEGLSVIEEEDGIVSCSSFVLRRQSLTRDQQEGFQSRIQQLEAELELYRFQEGKLLGEHDADDEKRCLSLKINDCHVSCLLM